MVAPVINFRWPSIPKSLMKNDYRREVAKWSFWIANYFPGLLQWWVTQNMFPTTSMLEKNPLYFNDQDVEVLKHTKGFPMLTKVILLFTKYFHYTIISSSFSPYIPLILNHKNSVDDNQTFEETLDLTPNYQEIRRSINRWFVFHIIIFLYI